MKKLLLLAAIAWASAHAETTYVTVSGEGWSLKVDAPAFTRTDGKTSGNVFRYTASSVETGVTLSVYVEPGGGDTNAACKEAFWSKGRQNPTISAGSEKMSSSAVAEYVTHRSEGVYRGTPFKMANGHAYMARKGRCVDIHVSHWPYKEGSEKLVEAILRSVSIVQ